MKHQKLNWTILALVMTIAISGIAMAEAIERLPAEVLPSGQIVEVPEVAIEKSPVLDRWILPNEYSTDRSKLEASGCTVVHELSDALAVKCPKGVALAGAIEDKILHTMDMDANIQINADDIWALGYDGAGITVAVLDTGVDYNHQELTGDIAGGKSFVSGVTDYFDDHGHGTHCAGIITSQGVVQSYSKGAAPGVKIWAGKVLNSAGSGYSTDIAAAIEDVVYNDRADIISMSLGGGGTTRANCDSDYLASKVNWAVDNGVTVVVAAGNDGSRVSSPGCASKAIAVGAVDKADVRASFSGIGQALDIMAPGVGIYSTLPGNTYANWSGTSMATPHVAAVVALIKQKNPDWTDAQIKDALYKTAKDLGAAGWDKYYGYGRVEAYNAVTYTPTINPPEPPTNCVPKGATCNCNTICDKKETTTSCPWDCK